MIFNIGSGDLHQLNYFVNMVFDLMKNTES